MNVCVEALYPTIPAMCERILGFRTAVSVTITTYACDSQTQAKTNGEWANHAGSILLGCLYSDADASVVIVLCQWLNHQQNYSRDTCK